MKKINFINTNPQTSLRETQCWLVGTMLLCIISISGIILLNVAQLPELYTRYKEIAQLQQRLTTTCSSRDEQNKLESIHKKLSTALNLIQKPKELLNSPISYLEAIVTACNKDLNLDKLQLNKLDFTLSLSCANLQHLSQYTATLKRTVPNIETLTIHNVQKQSSSMAGNAFNCVIKGVFTQHKKRST